MGLIRPRQRHEYAYRRNSRARLYSKVRLYSWITRAVISLDWMDLDLTSDPIHPVEASLELLDIQKMIQLKISYFGDWKVKLSVDIATNLPIIQDIYHHQTQ